MIQCSFERHGRAARDERRVHHVAVADDPADIGRGPPDIGRLQAKTPAAHAADVHLVAAMRVHGQLRLGGRAGGRKNVRWLVRFHRHAIARLSRPARHEVVPGEIPAILHRHAASPVRFSETTCSTTPPACRTASSTIGFSGTSFPFLYVTSAVKTRRDPLAAIRSASAFSPNPANTTRWIAPIRTVASISAIASGQIGM